MKMFKVTLEMKSACISLEDEFPAKGNEFNDWLEEMVSGLGIPEKEFTDAASSWFKIEDSTQMTVVFHRIGEIVLTKKEAN